MLVFYLYIIASQDKDGIFEGPSKIGITNDLDRRLKEIQTGNPNTLSIFTSMPFHTEKSAKYAESQLHKYIGRNDGNHRGEWFDYAPQEIFSKFFWWFDLEQKISAERIQEIKILKEDIACFKQYLLEYDLLVCDFLYEHFDDVKADHLYEDFSKKITKKMNNVDQNKKDFILPDDF